MRSISVLGSDKQVAKWIPLATQLKLIGSYAQTELGHGKAAGETAFLYGTRLHSHGNLTPNCPSFTVMGVVGFSFLVIIRRVNQLPGILPLSIPGIYQERDTQIFFQFLFLKALIFRVWKQQQSLTLLLRSLYWTRQRSLLWSGGLETVSTTQNVLVFASFSYSVCPD